MTAGVMVIAIGEHIASVWGRLARWARTQEGLRFLGLLLAAFLLRLLIAPFLMLTDDLRAYAYWGELALHHFFDAYSYGGANPDWSNWPAYPPLAFYIFGFLEGVYFGGAHLLGLHPLHDPAYSRMLRVLLKLPAILADMGIVSFIYLLARRVTSPKRALLATATYAFSPGILIVTLLWGQTDGAAVLLVALGLYFAYRRQGIWAGVLLALAVGFKPQPAIFVPLALVYLYRWGGWKEAARGISSFTGISVLLWLPYLLPPRFEVLAYVRDLGQIVQVERPTGSHGAFNLWYLLNAEWHPISQPLVGPFSLQLVSTILFGLIMLLVLAGIWRDGSQRMLWAAAALLALGFFGVGTLQFERYLTPAVALFLLAAIFDRRYWPCYIGVSVMLFLNFAATIFSCQCYEPAKRAPHQIIQLFTLDLTPKIGAAIIMTALALGLYWYVLSTWKPWKQMGHDQARAPAPVSMDVATAKSVPVRVIAPESGS